MEIWDVPMGLNSDNIKKGIHMRVVSWEFKKNFTVFFYEEMSKKKVFGF